VSWTRERARLAALKRHRPSDDPEITEAKRDLDVAVLEEHVRRVVDGAPPLSAEQRDRLAVLLRPTAGGAAG
jgi:hypothetical protein